MDAWPTRSPRLSSRPPASQGLFAAPGGIIGGDGCAHIDVARPELEPKAHARARAPIHPSELQAHGYIPLSCQLDLEAQKMNELTGIGLKLLR